MADLETREQECYCEDCAFFDDGSVPGECRKDHGQVAYRHRICESFQLQSRAEAFEKLSSKDE